MKKPNFLVIVADDMGIVDCELSPRQPRTKPSWNLPPEALAERFGPGEAARAVRWRALTAEQKAFQARKMEIHADMIHRLDREAGRVINQRPEGIQARGELRRGPSHFIDIVPTMLELAGQKTAPAWRGRESPPLAGVSLVEHIRKNGDTDREYIFFRHDGHRALRAGKWKLVAVHHGKWELYDMEADRSELHNVAQEHPDRVRQMAAQWERSHRTFIEQSGELRD